ncbi:MAG: chromosomal replication initiator protein DnaA [Sedimentisphaerales bacterium]|nr:chromosomal replication initiator protein DnaA [Sedimentisphaerales bacterium]MBN2842413.1 chromosomal replication initiator protein DnaA [Sedimentisphaerales bacterium]
MGEVLTNIWDKILRTFQQEYNALWRHWFEQLEPLSLDGGILRIGVAEESWRQYLSLRCSGGLTSAAQRITGHFVTIEYAMPGERTDADRRQTSEQAVVLDASEITYFNPDYTFDNFVVGPSNRLAHAACVAVSESPGETYNPLFIHGSVGLGKTHIMQAACQALKKRNPASKILYLTCETFVNDFVRALRQGDLYDFRYKYRYVDVLVIDDIQFLTEKEQSQEEFFHTFNSLYQSRKQIIISADSPPSEIPKLEDRLISRFNQGLVTRIDNPAFETRMAILYNKAALRGINPPEDVISFIAERITSNTRELEGALTKVYGYAMLGDGKITMELARQALGVESIPRHSQVTISQIIDAITSHFNVKLSDLQGKRRSRSIAYPRQICMYLARELTRHSLEEIGGHFGGRDHTTVMHSCRNIDNLCDHDPQVRDLVDSLVASLTK